MPKSKTQHRRRHHRNKSRKIRTRTRRGGVAPVAHAAPASTPAPTSWYCQNPADCKWDKP